MKRLISVGYLVMVPLAFFASAAAAQEQVNVSGPVSRIAWAPEEWFKTEQAARIADIVVTWQNGDGGWSKGYNASRPRGDDAPRGESMFDNGATYSEIRLLARAYTAQKKPRHKQAFDRGLEYLFKSQYDNGGWPQRYPLQDNYSRHVTFNDGAMIGVMRILEAIIKRQPDFAFVSEADRARAAASFNRGVDCILRTQIEVDGKLTGWCQQYDAKTLEPVGARTFELPGIASTESASLVMFLTSAIDNPDERVKRAIESAARWFESTKITGKRYAEVSGEQYENGRDRIIVDDPQGVPIWARFYEIGTNKPFFAGRDGVKRYDLKEVEHERRTGYAWYGRWGTRALDAYHEWKQRVAPAQPN